LKKAVESDTTKAGIISGKEPRRSFEGDLMKKRICCIVLLLFVVSCAPALRQDMLDKGIREVPFPGLLRNPDSYKGRLFILGGTIVNTETTDKGFLIEAYYVAVDSQAYLQTITQSKQRFLAFYPKEKGTLSPQLYKKEMGISLAAVFAGLRRGSTGKPGDALPVFQIEQIHLWTELSGQSPFTRSYPYPNRPYQPFSFPEYHQW
jgi:outer membrane lipoprotein